MAKQKLTKEQAIIQSLSKRIVNAQKPIRILNALKWPDKVQRQFFKDKFKKLPEIDKSYYAEKPIGFKPKEKTQEFLDIERDVKAKLGQFSGIGDIILRMCREYRTVIRLLQNRGTAAFTPIAQELYGSSNDAFYAGGPCLYDLANILTTTLGNIGTNTMSDADTKRFSAEEAVAQLDQRLNAYFRESPQDVSVVLSDGIISDAAAGADILKIRKGGKFSERDIRILEVHEGWVHIGTTFNGLSQPICTFLSKGPPSSTIYQEGLAVIMEIFTFASNPQRIERLTHRIMAIHMAEEGADFLEVFNFLRDEGLSEDESYQYTYRVFRGSLPNLGPFTKDLSYSKGFILVYNYIRLAIHNGLLGRIPLMFLGKTSIEDLKTYEYLLEDGTIVYPQFVPPQFQDLAGLTSWMAYSMFLNKVNIDKVSTSYSKIL